MPILQARGIVKHFGGVKALDGADFSLGPGEVHALIGSNGSGKSTLCKIFSGVVAPDAGEIFLNGARVVFNDPGASRARGLGVVYQELSLIPDLTVAENIMLGVEPRNGIGMIHRQALVDKAREMTGLFEPAFSAGVLAPDTYVHQLKPDEKQIVEILKILVRDPRIIIFDEATSSLHARQVELFFDLLRELKDRGKAIIFISHRLDEVFEIGDRATVVRNGKAMATVNLKESSREEIVYSMVGQRLDSLKPRVGARSPGREVLQVKGLSTAKLKDISLSLKGGEILGLGGLNGQGQSELLLCLFGARRLEKGSVTLQGKTLKHNSPLKAMNNSLAYISGDRKKYGVLLIRPILDNMILSLLIKVKQFFYRRRGISRKVYPVLERLKLVFDRLDHNVNELSGGNQQKVVIGRWLLTEPRVILMDDPTKGVDIHSKEELYELMEAMARDGVAIMWHSSEDQELLNNTHRLLVFNDGRITAELAGDRLNKVELYQAAMASQQSVTRGSGNS